MTKKKHNTNCQAQLVELTAHIEQLSQTLARVIAERNAAQALLSNYETEIGGYQRENRSLGWALESEQCQTARLRRLLEEERQS